MKKIPTIYIRDENNRQFVTNTINPVCQWVFDGEGIATQKYDGTCCLIKNGVLYKRREIKKTTIRGDNIAGHFYHVVPVGFIETDRDEITGKVVGWVPVKSDPEDRWHIEAFIAQPTTKEGWKDGTYELVGPKINGNPENYDKHTLLPHAEARRIPEVFPRNYQNIKAMFEPLNQPLDIEGVVYHHPDGRMAKIKKKDFGLKRK